MNYYCEITLRENLRNFYELNLDKYHYYSLHVLLL